MPDRSQDDLQTSAGASDPFALLIAPETVLDRVGRTGSSGESRTVRPLDREFPILHEGGRQTANPSGDWRKVQIKKPDTLKPEPSQETPKKEEGKAAPPPTLPETHALPPWEELLRMPLQEAEKAVRRAYLTARLAEAQGNVAQLAQKIGLERTHLYRLLFALGISSQGEQHAPIPRPRGYFPEGVIPCAPFSEKIRAERSRTGVGALALYKTLSPDIQTKNPLKELERAFSTTARKPSIQEQFAEAVLAAYASLPDSPTGRRQRRNEICKIMGPINTP